MVNLFRGMLPAVPGTASYPREQSAARDRESREARRERFEREILPHVDSAFNLARWLTLDEQAASDVVEESFARAMERFHGYRGQNPKVWLLAIVRDVCRAYPDERGKIALDEDEPSEAGTLAVHEAIELLPCPDREVLVLHDLESMTVGDIAAVERLPVASVRTLLTRAHSRVQNYLTGRHRDTV